MRSAIGTIALFVVIAAVSLFIVIENKRANDQYCQARGAQAVRTAPNTYVCFDKQGRLIP